MVWEAISLAQSQQSKNKSLLDSGSEPHVPKLIHVTHHDFSEVAPFPARF